MTKKEKKKKMKIMRKEGKEKGTRRFLRETKGKQKQTKKTIDIKKK